MVISPQVDILLKVYLTFHRLPLECSVAELGRQIQKVEEIR